MLTAFFDFVRHLAWELVILQLNPLLALIFAGMAGIAVWGAVRLVRR